MSQRAIAQQKKKTVAAGPAPDPSKEVALTNQSGVSAVVLIPTLSDAQSDDAGTKVWGQDLELLTSTAGTPVVANGATGTFVLDQYFTDPNTGKKTYSTIYNLLVSDARWYAPLANLGVMQNFEQDPPAYSPQKVTKDDAAALANAGVFYQTISAYPTSQLTKDFQNAMAGANDAAAKAADGSAQSSQNVQDAISNNADAFFKGTKSFKNVTLAGLVAMENYYGSFPFVWAQFGTRTYWLYSSDGKATSFVGTLSLSPPPSLDLTRPNAGYTCTFTPAVNPTDTTSVAVDSSNAKSLTYMNSLFVDDLNSDLPNIAVKGTFQVKRLFTQKPTDTQIIPVLTGTIGGAVCIGFDSPQKSDDKENSEFWNSLFHPKNSSEIFKSFMTLGGAAMMLAFLGQIGFAIFKWARGLAAGKAPTTAELLQQQQDALAKVFQDKIDSAISKLTNGKQEAPKSPAEANETIAKEQSAVIDNQNAARLQDGLESQASSLQELAKYESKMSSDQLLKLESAGSDVAASNEALKGASADQLHDVVATQSKALDSIKTEVSDLSLSLDSTLSAQAKATIADNAAAVEQVQQDVENADKNQADDEENLDPDADDPIVPEGL